MGTEQRDDATFRYISMVNNVPALKRDDELRLAQSYLDDGDLRAKDAVVRANLRCVVPIAMRYSRYGVPLSELIGQGNLALVAALDRFEPARQLRFSTYASHWIRAEVLGLMLNNRSLVGGGRGPLRGKFVFGLQRQLAGLMALLGEQAPALEILSQRFGKSPAQLAEILARVNAPDASLDAPVRDDVAVSALDLLEAREPDAQRKLQEGQEQTRVGLAVRSAASRLNDRERFILDRRLMADREDVMSLGDIGRHFGVSRERARQIETVAKDKLRKSLIGLAGELNQLSAA